MQSSVNVDEEIESILQVVRGRDEAVSGLTMLK